jgi:L-threonylcarbamoyladenylate synthase
VPVIAPTPEAVRECARLLRGGGMVGMPTETVYGLACNALDEEAVRRVFAAKGRPAENPLIVHVGSADEAASLSAAWPAGASALAGVFWPGPLTLVVPKGGAVADVVTGGLDTVALRVPDHPVALALLAACGVPLAAPSANRFGGLSPTRAEDVESAGLAPGLPVLDGGPCEVGIESTVLDLSGPEARLLRPGRVGPDQVAAVLGRPVEVGPEGAARRSPGLYARHYAPSVPVRLVPVLPAWAAGLALTSEAGPSQVRMPSDPHDYARLLYAALRTVEALRPDEILVEQPPEGGDWAAVTDRLRRASAR